MEKMSLLDNRHNRHGESDPAGEENGMRGARLSLSAIGTEDSPPKLEPEIRMLNHHRQCHRPPRFYEKVRSL